MGFVKTIQVSDSKKKKNYSSKQYLNRKKIHVNPIHHLQNSIGNQAVNRMINNKTILTKLKDTHRKDPFGSIADNIETKVDFCFFYFEMDILFCLRKFHYRG